MYRCFTYMYVYAQCVCSTFGDQKRALDFLELEFQDVIPHVGARN